MEAIETLYKKLQKFSEVNQQFNICFTNIQHRKKLTKKQIVNCLLRYVSEHIFVVPEYFSSVIETFPAEIPLLLIQAISFNTTFNQNRHIINCILLSNIVRERSDLKSYALEYFQRYPSPFDSDEDYQFPSKKGKIELPENINITELTIVKAIYYLLISDVNFFRHKWKWSTFIKNYVLNGCDKSLWLASHIVGIVVGFNEPQINHFIAINFSKSEAINLTLKFNLDNLLSSEQKHPLILDKNPVISANSKKVSNVVNIAGLYIRCLEPIKENLLVEVPSTLNNLRKIALGLSSNNKALCLQGPIGSGKTRLIEHIALKTGRKLGESFIKVQLGDQTDSKMLLGTYRCTDIPGEFIWQPGVLTQAVIQGNWLLLEDIDSASMDVLSLLASLLDNNALTVPGYRDLVPITPGFQLIVTQRFIPTISGYHKKQTNALQLLEKELLQITIDPLTNDELKQILQVQYPQFDTVSERFVKVFQIFIDDQCENSYWHSKTTRFVSTRDLFKWCARAAIGFDVKSQESALNVLQDAIDVFCCSIPDENESLKLAKKICTQLGIVNHEAEFFYNNHKPLIQITAKGLGSGRVFLEKSDTGSMKQQIKFCPTRQAVVLLERIMCCLKLNEPVLLVGETGTGKTSSVQYLAQSLGKKLIVINMNQQSDSADLLGGFKPVDLKFIIAPIKRQFEDVFSMFFNLESNKIYLGKIDSAFNNQKYIESVKLMRKSTAAALKRLFLPTSDKEKQAKQKIYLPKWQIVNEKLIRIETQLKHSQALAFAFIEGSLVKAVQNGWWILLDEINLASAETLECLSGLLEGTNGSLCLLERGDKQPVTRHSDFTLFACMNPATNIGKKDLPLGLRNRFTEFYVHELTDKSDLILLIEKYLEGMSLKENEIAKIANFYLQVRKEMLTSLSDGLGDKPHFSLRTLCRALMIASKNPCGNVKKSLYESFCLSFLTQLDSKSYEKVEEMIARSIVGNEKAVKAILNQPIPEPRGKNCKFLLFEGYWIKQGHLKLNVPEEYILTKSVRKNLKDLSRIVSIGKLPVLLQGDTSVGKTSLIQYLAKSSGNKCVRINNHEHTDLQEYIGSYVADANGKLVFREGILVEAMRNGYWIILDELNLAPTDVLEALNRVLDDNRELFIPETQETVKANPNFILFATQNPPGTYGGRKILSRAFRNRFIELHFNEIPSKELELILQNRCAMSMSYAKKMVNVMTDLQIRRRSSAPFAGKQGFITLRDLFRWGERYRLANIPNNKLYDWNQHMADEGYLFLAGKVRKSDEQEEIIKVLNKHWQRNICLENLFSLHENTSSVTKHVLEKLKTIENEHPNIAWTFNMRKLAVLVGKAMEFNEPILLVGDTGGGKTTICQLIADINGRKLISLNCHMNTESSDFIGGLRPIRDHTDDANALFEWVDGPLLVAMRNGNIFLADEISLADDSVLERLNSLLEPERTLLLAEKGIDVNNMDNSETIVAHTNFVFIGTMNPGGDFGKKELSPALRNRFTEIWCDSHNSKDDLLSIIETNLLCDNRQDLARKMLDFIEWYRTKDIGKKSTISIRDILTWVNFINKARSDQSCSEAFFHGAHLVFLDSLGAGVTSTENINKLHQFKTECQTFLLSQFHLENIASLKLTDSSINITESHFGIGPFSIAMGDEIVTNVPFSFETVTTLLNTLNILRGMQLNKAILLEGSPGVGKTSLITALASITRHKLLRVNLSDQTDISDLFGADLPVEGGNGGEFSWRDGPLLQALKEGSWILLDELNLASQSVLEGLNACLDHRGEIFIPELNKTFHVKTDTRFFACQNPMKQGGCRRGLPKSFLNRFIQVYVSPFNQNDMEVILSNQFSKLPNELIKKMVRFNFALEDQLDHRVFGAKGSPWECNLRDLTRWCEATLFHYDRNSCLEKTFQPESTVKLIYIDRMRTLQDKETVQNIFEEIIKRPIKCLQPMLQINENHVHFGDISIKRSQDTPNYNILKQCNKGQLILQGQISTLRSLSYCINQNWMTILVGNSGVGKSSVVKTLANLAGKTLKTLPVTSAMDTIDILGGFEQTNYSRHLEEIVQETERVALALIQKLLLEKDHEKAVEMMEYWENYLIINEGNTYTMEEEVNIFLRKIEKIKVLLVALLYCEDKQEVIQSLLNKCSNISNTVKQEKSLSAGGRFEWINSVLVKCLQEGSWLLIDNVNLCSAAVLDRLNALLEPNGILTISERGVDNDNGKMYEVKPHKDFRIFLTMDPKNGEISRAMRNRGLEIYMLDESESEVPKSIESFDTKALINNEGLSDLKYVNALIDIHKFLVNIIISNKPKLMDILHCASLISQQIDNGIDIFESFYNTCIDIYYKTRLPNEFNCNNVLELIKDKILQCLNSVTSLNSTDFYSGNVRLNTRHLPRWSNYELSKYESAILEKSMEKYNIRNLTKINFKSKSELEILKENAEYFTNANFYNVSNLLLLSFTMSTSANLNYKYKYLTETVKQTEWILKLVNKMNDVLKEQQIVDRNLTIDHQWMDETNISNQFDTSIVSNSINYKLQLEVIKIKNNIELELLSPENSIYRLLIARKQKITHDIFNNSICTYYFNLIEEYYKFLQQLPTKWSIKTGKYLMECFELISWQQLFSSFIINIKVSRNEIKNPEMFLKDKLNLINLLYKWFYKYSIEKMKILFNIHNLPSALNDVLNSINDDVGQQFSNIYKITKNYKNLNDVPKCLKHEWQRTALVLLEKYEMNHTNMYSVLGILKSNENLRKSLIELKNDIYSDNETNVKTATIMEIENECKTNLLEHNEIRVFLLLDTLTQMYLLHTILNIEMKNNHLNLYFLRDNILMPVEFNGILLNYNNTKNFQLIHEIRKNYFIFSMNSISNDLNRWIKKSETDDDNSCLIKKYQIAGVYPIFTNLFSRLLVDEKLVTLKNHKNWENEYRYYSLILWNNIYDMADKKYDYISLQLSLLLKNGEAFLNTINLALQKTFENNDNLDVNVKKIENQSIRILISKIIELHEQLPENLSISSFADLHILLGYSQAYINSFLSEVDPLVRKTMKKNHLESIIVIFQQMATSFTLQNSLIRPENEKCIHNYYEEIQEKINDLQQRIGRCGKNISSNDLRVHKYSQVMQQIKHAFSTILHPNNDLFISIGNPLSTESNTKNEINLSKMTSNISHIESNIQSYERIIEDMKQFRNSYPDIIEPLLANLAQFLYGIKLKLYWMKREYYLKYQHSDVDLEEELINFVALPCLNGNFSNLEDYVDNYCDRKNNMHKIIEYFMDDQMPHVKTKEHLRLLLCALQEYSNQCIINNKINGELDKKLLDKVNTLIYRIITMWNAQQDKEEQDKTNSESIYKIKTICDDKTEEEENAEELADLFPNYHTLDFPDFQNESSKGNHHHESTTLKTYPKIISENDLQFVIDLHGNLLRNFIKSEWLITDSNKTLIMPNLVYPIVEKYKLVKYFMESHGDYFLYTMDSKLIGSLSVLLDISRHYGVCLEQISFPSVDLPNKKSKDFYEDSDIDQVKSCYSVLDELKQKVNELLLEWPEQPTLTTIIIIIDRILNFELTSPLSRFLTGFDILLAKCYEWEAVAHSGVSLNKISANLITQIITWRKLELNRWKDLLNSTFERMKKNLQKWWIHIYNLMNDYVIKEQNMQLIELVDVLQTFITKSPLVEFKGRLNIIYEFHLHSASLVKRTKASDNFANILWNIYNYFNQFSNTIDLKLKDLRKPIEKKLKDYVKIVVWKDINYWSVKNTVDKSHKTLHKIVKEYKEVLQQPVTSYLSNPVTNNAVECLGIWDRPQRPSIQNYYSLDVDTYIVQITSSKNILHLPTAQRICKEMISSMKYPEVVKSLDLFITNIIETSSHLQNLEIDKTLTKKKQISQGKSILQQKNRALAELFQQLSKMGVSYKTGLLNTNLKNSTEDFLIKPINLSASFSHLMHKKIDEKILSIWESSEMYYYKGLMRFDLLNNAIINNLSKDLGMRNVERCRGFGAQLLWFCQQQKKCLIESSRSYYYLQNYSNDLHEIAECTHYISSTNLVEIKNLLHATILITSQIKIILNSCTEDELEYEDIPSIQPANTNRLRRKHDKIWLLINQYLNEMDSLISKISTYIQKRQLTFPALDHEIFTSNFILPFNEKNQLIEDVKNLIEITNKMEQIFTPIPVSDSLKWLTKCYLEFVDKINSENLIESTNCNINDTFEQFRESILIIIQNLYKKYRKPEERQENVNETEDDEDLHENHIKILLIENLSNDVDKLELTKLLKLCETLLNKLLCQNICPSANTKKLLTNCIPLFDQVLLLSEYFITQQISSYRTTCKLTSILLNIFIDLATKGFCIPQDLSEEIQQEGTNSKSTDGPCGLSDEQPTGNRDISDQIETEDQLDDAQPEGKDKDSEEKVDDPDCREEDGGIEMSEDFDSKLQDKKPVDSENDENDGDSDAEEQMGETGKGADQVDQEIWGNDDDDSEQEEDSEDVGEGGQKDGNDELGAKDENAKQKETSDKQNKETGNDDNKEKEEINEMNEPEYDDEQIDPYHGNQMELPEPEPMDLPDDLQLDDGEANDENVDDNPFDTAEEANESEIPEDKSESDLKEEKEKRNDEVQDFSDDDEPNNDGDGVTVEEHKSDEEEDANASMDDQNPKTKDSCDDNDETGENEEDVKENALDQNVTNQDNVEAMDVENVEGTDKTQPAPNQNIKSDQQVDNVAQEDQPDKDGVGQSQMEECESGHSASVSVAQNLKSSNFDNEINKKKKNERPGKSNSKRTLGDVNLPVQKRLKTVDFENNPIDKDDMENNTAEAYQHIQEATEKSTAQVLDVATEEQADEQKTATHADEKEDKNDALEGSDELAEDDEEYEEDMDIPELINEKAAKPDSTKEKLKNKNQHPEGDVMDEMVQMEIDGEIVPTYNVPRGNQSTHHTQYHVLKDTTIVQLSPEEINKVRMEVEQQMSSWKTMPACTTEVENTWQKISSVTYSLAQDLSEQLRLILEPTQASHLKGDFRSGRRINMRKIIPYIASQFRKDKIWLRRVKPSKRDYQIVLAIDDSASMTQNKSRQLTFESVALISKALSLLESGQLGVVSYGKTINIHHKLNEPFTDQSGVELLQSFKFDQQDTLIGELVHFIIEMFEQNKNNSKSSNPIAKLLLIVGDGQNIFQEGKSYIAQAVRKAKLAGIFMVFVVIDSPENKYSVMDAKTTVFNEKGECCGFVNYMDEFPFPFYIILRDINYLPGVLSDALMQWFELVTTKE